MGSIATPPQTCKRSSAAKPRGRAGFTWSEITGHHDTNPLPHAGTWDEFARGLERPAVRADTGNGPAWIPARFGGVRNVGGGLRHGGNVREVTAVVLDLDGDGGRHYHAAELRRRLKGLRYVAHTTRRSEERRGGK